MPSITLKIDVDTYRGTKEGVPHLVRLLKKHNANATFLFSLGPDHTGWALRRAFRPGFFKKVSRTSVLEHYGLKTLLYGVLLPAPDIGLECAAEMRAVQDAGFECGIHTWDHVLWQDNVRAANVAWTQRQMLQSCERFRTIFGQKPPTHGAAGWQMNQYAFEQLDAFGVAYASDTRAMLSESGAPIDPNTGPYKLQISGKTLSCIQMPTTLPTLDEMLGRTINGEVVTPANIADTLLQLTQSPREHVYTLHAELEGQKFAPIFEQLLLGWQEQGYDCISMAQLHQKIKNLTLPTRPLSWAELPGRSGQLIVSSI